jgi:hypothetical protein
MVAPQLLDWQRLKTMMGVWVFGWWRLEANLYSWTFAHIVCWGNCGQESWSLIFRTLKNLKQENRTSWQTFEWSLPCSNSQHDSPGKPVCGDHFIATDEIYPILLISTGIVMAIYWRPWLFQVLWSLYAMNAERYLHRGKKSSCHKRFTYIHYGRWGFSVIVTRDETWIFHFEPETKQMW